MKVTQLYLTLCHPTDYTVHEILQVRILKWVAFPFSRGSSPPRNQTRSPALQANSLPDELPGKPVWVEAKRPFSGLAHKTLLRLMNTVTLEVRAYRGGSTRRKEPQFLNHCSGTCSETHLSEKKKSIFYNSCHYSSYYTKPSLTLTTHKTTSALSGSIERGGLCFKSLNPDSFSKWEHKPEF